MDGVRDRPASGSHAPTLLACALALAPLLPSGVAMAAAHQLAPPLAGQIGWSIRPALAGETSLPQGHFAYALPAGAQIADAVEVQDTRGRGVRLSLYGADLASVAGGGVAPLQQDARMRTVGAWLRLHATETVPAGGRVLVPFQLDVPPDVQPGRYSGAVVAAGLTGASTRGLAVAFRTALIVDVNVVHRAKPRLIVHRLRAAERRGVVTFSLPVENGGNVSLSLRGRVRILDGRGREIAVAATGPANLYVVPGGRALLHAVWTPPQAWSRLAAAPLVATDIGGTPGPTYRGPRVAIPPRAPLWWALLRGAGAASGLAAVWCLIGRRRGKVARRPPDGGDAGAAGDRGGVDDP